MNILITGAVGFIGFHTSLKLLEKKHKIIGVDSLNSYYDVRLKKKRLNILKKNIKINLFFIKLIFPTKKKSLAYLKNIRLIKLLIWRLKLV